MVSGLIQKGKIPVWALAERAGGKREPGSRAACPAPLVQWAIFHTDIFYLPVQCHQVLTPSDLVAAGAAGAALKNVPLWLQFCPAVRP